MKTIRSLALCAVLLLSLAACGGAKDESVDEGLPQPIGTVTINTEGLGQIAFAETLEELTFSDEQPYTSSVFHLIEPATYVIGAKETQPDWTFVKWTKDGADYTTDAIFSAELSESADFVAVFAFTDLPKSEQTGTAGSNIPLKDNAEEAERQIKAAMQLTLEELYGDKIDDARIYVEKIYTAEDEREEPLQSMNLGIDEVAFTVRTDLHPSEGADVEELMIPNGEYDEQSGWIVGKLNVGVLRPNEAADTPKYVVTDFGTGF